MWMYSHDWPVAKNQTLPISQRTLILDLLFHLFRTVRMSNNEPRAIRLGDAKPSSDIPSCPVFGLLVLIYEDHDDIGDFFLFFIHTWSWDIGAVRSCPFHSIPFRFRKRARQNLRDKLLIKTTLALSQSFISFSTFRNQMNTMMTINTLKLTNTGTSSPCAMMVDSEDHMAPPAERRSFETITVPQAPQNGKTF